jgi:hypothetical protein
MFSNFSRLEFVDLTGAMASYPMVHASIKTRTGLRLDGRRAEEVRHTSFARVIVPGADGAVFLQQGGTHVLASVWGPREVWHAHHRRFIVSVSVFFIFCVKFGANEAQLQQVVRKSSQKHDRCALVCNVTVAP